MSVLCLSFGLLAISMARSALLGVRMQRSHQRRRRRTIPVARIPHTPLPIKDRFPAAAASRRRSSAGRCHSLFPLPAGIAGAAARTSSAKRGAETTCRSSAARSCRCRMIAGSSPARVRSRARTRHASALSLSAAVSTGSTQGYDGTSGGCLCVDAISQRIGRATQRRRLERHLDADMRPQPLAPLRIRRRTRERPKNNGFRFR